MGNLYFCTACKRVVKGPEQCEYCKGESLKELAIGAPVNVIGTKLKGKILKISDNAVKVLIKDENKDKLIKEYKPEKLRKVI